jgi:hypothetical protein
VPNPPPAKGGTAVSVSAGTAAVAAPDTRTDVQTYLDEIAPASIVGRMMKFDTKGGRFFTADDDQEISADDASRHARIALAAGIRAAPRSVRWLMV